ncbi:hypothetical protein SAMN05660235_01332 [Sporolituus thermophilus DSM 23256]|uniref:Uncharacterized protein n=1 Tax=Sporolituus thermophilus DSM 23256 TaxID=1123285 RepID=A0A1G7KH60_9FIRM|nr:hypothetical protein SAMN05660235_01332 [Sporolituus thermophilus DSM 23256]
MATLVAIYDLWLLNGQGTLQATDDEGFIQRAGQFVINDVAAVPVDDNERYMKPFFIRM